MDNDTFNALYDLACAYVEDDIAAFEPSAQVFESVFAYANRTGE